MTDSSLEAIAGRLGRSAADLQSLIARINAAAIPQGDTSWVDLIAPDAEPSLRSALEALRLADTPSPQAWSPDRLAGVRRSLSEAGVDGFIVPQSDPHMGEYIPARHHRLAWLTGFTGSAGLAILYRDMAALFIDGRYTLQASEQVDANLIEARHFQKPAPKKWLCDIVQEGDRIGFDPTLFSVAQADDWRAALEKQKADLVALAVNPIDANWTDQPPEPLSPMVPHPLACSGESVEDKCARLAEKLREDGVDAAVLNQLEAVAWLLNVRGNDVENKPLSVSTMVLHADGTVDLYVESLRLSKGLGDHLGNRVSLIEFDQLEAGLQRLGAGGKRVGLTRATAVDRLRTILEEAGAEIVPIDDCTELPRAIKNEVELTGARSAHRRDAAAVARVLEWLSRDAQAGGLTELDVVARLEAERGQEDQHRGPSFDTISGAGPHGAIVHYRVTPDSNAAIEPDSLLLIDSGAQYLDGTTDITRTIAVGTPPPGTAENFTLVLKGHIAVARAHFPEGTTGAQIDALARQFLWQAGKNFDHGTGHGVGSYLGVHEGPQRLAPTGHTKLQPGMILSNEPGYYENGAYGIRIENLVIVRESARAEGFLEFETITFAPIDRTLIVADMLDEAERGWLNAYHAQVFETVAPALDTDRRAWLEAATAPI